MNPMPVHPTTLTNTVELKNIEIQHNDSLKFQYPTVTSRYVIQTIKINKETSELNDTIDQMDLTDIYRS
jgi:hypothetical protein